MQRDIYEAVIAHVLLIGPVHVDAVRVGVFLKHERKFAEVRPKVRSLSLELVLPREVEDARIVRRIRISEDRTVHVIKLTRPDEVDEDVRAWLTEAYLAAGG